MTSFVMCYYRVWGVFCIYKLIWVLRLLVRRIIRLNDTTLFHICQFLRPRRLKFLSIWNLFGVVAYTSLPRTPWRPWLCLVHHCTPSLAQCGWVDKYLSEGTFILMPRIIGAYNMLMLDYEFSLFYLIFNTLYELTFCSYQ